MAFMLFKKERDTTGTYYSYAHENFKLAGNGLIYRLWNKRNKPIKCGWSVTADDLLKEHGEGLSGNEYALVIDFDPESQERIGLVEIEAIHIYTNGYDGTASWSPMMLELRDVYYDEDDFDPDKKPEFLQRVPVSQDRKKIMEFLYLQGSWNWGRNGSTNAAFIFDDARKYFQQFFAADIKNINGTPDGVKANKNSDVQATEGKHP